MDKKDREALVKLIERHGPHEAAARFRAICTLLETCSTPSLARMAYALERVPPDDKRRAYTVALDAVWKMQD